MQGGKTARAMRAANMFSEKQAYQRTSIIDIPPRWDDYIASKSPSLRRQFQRLICDLFAGRQVEYIRHRPLPASKGDGDPRWDLYASCELIAAAWQPDVANGNSLSQERVRKYFRETHAAAARLGMLDVHVLTIEGQPSAFLYGYHHHGNVIVLRADVDASNDNGIGSALMLQAIQDSCHRGDRTIDLGPGESEHKRQLRTRTESTYRITYTPMDSWRSQAVRFTRWAKRRLQPGMEAATN
jgi:hypothetical protein